MAKRSRFAVSGGEFRLDGKPFQILCGELHYPRIPREYWRHRLELARAMGLNTVCLYLFWNYHETAPGKFDFTGDRDVVAFTRLCQELGLWVILRPGPYSCAEWDFGGFPWWLLKDPAMQLRCSYPGFLKPAERYLKQVGKQLAKMQITRGGPILMVQVENEYGAFGNDKAYLRSLKQTLRDAGFDVPLMRCDWAWPGQLVPGDFDESVVTVANFGSKAERNITALRHAYPQTPKMCGEFWMGWFDWWGHPRNGKETADGETHLQELKWMLENQASFSLYMLHGGTNFGFSSGANNHDRYDPYVTSYDYWAPLTENGVPREKYFKFRDLIAEKTGRALPEVPAAIPTVAIPRFTLAESAPLLGKLKPGHRRLAPEPMEQFDQGHGCILYRTDLAGRAAGEADLRIRDVHDYAWVYLNGSLVGTIDRHLKQDRVKLAVPTDGPAVLEILVEAMGRVNFGPTMTEERKGITRRVEHGFLTLFDWEIVNLPLDAAHLASLRFSKKDTTRGPAFFRGSFDAPREGDTFLDLRGWGKGYVWVNGRLLGRYWSIGPQQTLYVPGAWLKRKKNQVVVLDLFNTTGQRSIEGLAEPVLEELKLPPEYEASLKPKA
jgi:beta-galactosidase